MLRAEVGTQQAEAATRSECNLSELVKVKLNFKTYCTMCDGVVAIYDMYVNMSLER